MPSAKDEKYIQKGEVRGTEKKRTRDGAQETPKENKENR